VGQRVGIVDASCLIGLSKVQMETLPLQLYTKVIIPPAVQAEFGGAVEGYIVQPPSNRVHVQTLRLMLGAGESEVIALGVELSQGGEQVEMVLDDLQARRIALSYGLRIVGTVGLLIRAKQSGYIESVRAILQQMRASGFRCSPELFRRAIELAQEGDD
jgi:predicted nucleic acid-binding protein